MVLALGCESPPPSAQLSAGETAVAGARKDGADIFAPAQWKEAEAALAEAKRKAGEKDYQGAILAARDAVEKAHVASVGAAAAKTVARSATGVAQAEVRAMLDEIAPIRAEAAKARVPEKVFEELQPLVDDAERTLKGVAETLEKGDLLGAQKAATELKAKISGLPDRFQAALDAWNASHGKKKPRPAQKR